MGVFYFTVVWFSIEYNVFYPLTGGQQWFAYKRTMEPDRAEESERPVAPASVGSSKLSESWMKEISKLERLPTPAADQNMIILW